MNEPALRKSIQVAASRVGARLFRNNVGKLQDKTGRWVSFGLCVGSCDLIGWTADGRFLALELKTAGTRTTLEQRRFIDGVLACGGRAGVARSVDDAMRIIQDA